MMPHAPIPEQRRSIADNVESIQTTLGFPGESSHVVQPEWITEDNRRPLYFMTEAEIATTISAIREEEFPVYYPDKVAVVAHRMGELPKALGFRRTTVQILDILAEGYFPEVTTRLEMALLLRDNIVNGSYLKDWVFCTRTALEKEGCTFRVEEDSQILNDRNVLGNINGAILDYLATTQGETKPLRFTFTQIGFALFLGVPLEYAHEVYVKLKEHGFTALYNEEEDVEEAV